MKFQSRTFWFPKDPGHGAEYQDAYATDPEVGRAAIADGVASSIFAGRWAEILTKAVVDLGADLDDDQQFGEWLQSQRQLWWEPIDPSQLAWHQKPKLREGAFTTLLWIQLYAADVASGYDPNTYHMRCVAVGDCVMQHVRQQRVLRSFPMESSDQFDLDPMAIGSVDLGRDGSLEFETVEQFCRSGDLIVLMTDALGAWALACAEGGQPPDWDQFWEMSDDQWSERIEELRKNDAIRHDDTTLVLMRIE